MQNLSNEFIWEVNAIKRKPNQISAVYKDMAVLQNEIIELKAFFGNQIYELERELKMLRRENSRLHKELKRNIWEDYEVALVV